MAVLKNSTAALDPKMTQQTLYPGDFVKLATDGKFYQVEAIANNQLYVRNKETGRAFWVRRDDVRLTDR